MSLFWQLTREKCLIPKCSEIRGNSSDISKGIFQIDIRKFESCRPSHAVRSPSAKMRVVPTLPQELASRGMPRRLRSHGDNSRCAPPSALPSRALPPAAFDHEFDELGWLAGAL